MATCVRLKRHRAIIITLYLVVACYPFLLVFFSSFFFYLFCVSRTSGSDSFSLRTHTHHLSLDLSLRLSRIYFFARQSHADNHRFLFVYFFYTPSRIRFFPSPPFFFLSQSFRSFYQFYQICGYMNIYSTIG